MSRSVSQPPPPAAVTAMGKRQCPDCGGELEWNSAKQLIACPYCGFIPKEQPAGAAGGAPQVSPIQELDLERALAEVGDDRRGYREAKVQVKCQSCHAISVFEPGRV